jgi:hypothetical protein
MSQTDDENQRKTLLIDDCFNEISPRTLFELFRLSYLKMNLKFSDDFKKHLE